jgi:hypothetical protein
VLPGGCRVVIGQRVHDQAVKPGGNHPATSSLEFRTSWLPSADTPQRFLGGWLLTLLCNSLKSGSRASC